MAEPPRVLVVDPRAASSPLSGPKDPAAVAKVVATISDALSELERTGYDAVLLRIDGPGEVSLIVRVKESAPDIPVIALVPEAHEELRALARDSGADIVQALSTAPATEALLRTSHALLAASRELRRELRASLATRPELEARHAELIEDLSVKAARASFAGLRPLLVEDDENQALLLRRCLRTAGVSLDLPTTRDGTEAIEYLEGRGRFADRATYPLPTLVLLDLRLPRKSGLEVLAWIRSRPDFAGLIVFVLTTSALPDDVDRAISAGADSYFVKPTTLADMERTAGRLALLWSRLHAARSRMS